MVHLFTAVFMGLRALSASLIIISQHLIPSQHRAGTLWHCARGHRCWGEGVGVESRVPCEGPVPPLTFSARPTLFLLEPQFLYL